MNDRTKILLKLLIIKRDLEHVLSSVLLVHINFEPNWATVAPNNMTIKGSLRDVASPAYSTRI